MLDFNIEQSRGLSNFLFDIAKGMILGSIGSFVIAPFRIGMITSFVSSITAYYCVKIALNILGDIYAN